MNGFEMVWTDDESFDIWFNDEYVCNVNHDLHGYAGMGLAGGIVTQVAEILGVDWVDTYL